MRRSAEEAHEIALTTGDRDLEAAALALLGYAELAGGEVPAGTDRLDEAMAAATGGDVRSSTSSGTSRALRSGRSSSRRIGSGSSSGAR